MRVECPVIFCLRVPTFKVLLSTQARFQLTNFEQKFFLKKSAKVIIKGHLEGSIAPSPPIYRRIMVSDRSQAKKLNESQR